MSLPRIAESTGVTTRTVSLALARHGLREVAAKFVLDESLVIARYNSGETAAALAISLGCTKQSIYRILDRNDVSPRKKYKLRQRKENA